MPRQNRVNPVGEIVAIQARGHLMGNRGLIHNPDQEITRSFRLHAWIACELEFKGRQRQVMSPGKYTELFFWDEATAYTAGHRPCGECRYPAYKRFKNLFIDVFKSQLTSSAPRISEIDDIIHKSRMRSDGSKRIFMSRLGQLPDGVFVRRDQSTDCWIKQDGKLHLWSHSGYGSQEPLRPQENVEVLTPDCYVELMRRGLQTEIRF